MYKSVSAFAPIANPINCPWGQKAFEGYFGKEDKERWAEHDATELVKKWEGEPLDVLVDVVCSALSFLFIVFFVLQRWICAKMQGKRRAQRITSTSKASSCPRISQRRQRGRGK